MVTKNRKTGLRRPGPRTKGAEQAVQDQGMVTKNRKTGLRRPGPRTKGAEQGVQDQGNQEEEKQD
jgi:hypothetical protein